MAVVLAVVAGLVALWPGEANAWGPVTHLIHGSQVLAGVSTLGPALQEILQHSHLAYLYGCIAPDIMHAKKYTRSLYTHCHCCRRGTSRSQGQTKGTSS